MTKLRDMHGAVDEMRYVVDLLPNRAIFRNNLALYANYAGDFQLAEEGSARAAGHGRICRLSPWRWRRSGRASSAEAIATYEKLANAESARRARLPRPASPIWPSSKAASPTPSAFSSSAPPRDLAEKKPDRGGQDFAALAYAELSRGRKPAAIAAADKALANSKAVKIRFLAARDLHRGRRYRPRAAAH